MNLAILIFIINNSQKKPSFATKTALNQFYHFILYPVKIMKKILSATKSVLEIKDLHFEGNVVPHNWYVHIKNKSGASDLLAITLLSEIVYWHRLTPVYDKEKDELLGYKKKFAKDKLQKQTKELAEKFGFSEQSTNSALKRLVDLKLITREFRDITLKNGSVIQKRQFLDIVPTNIILISTIQERCTSKLHTLDKKVVQGVQESYPYTCITSENTNKEESNTPTFSKNEKTNSNTENQTSVNEMKLPLNSQSGATLNNKVTEPKQPTIKTDSNNTVKTTETASESTNEPTKECLYTSVAKMALNSYNDIAKRKYTFKRHGSVILKRLKAEFSKEEIQDPQTFELIKTMLEVKFQDTTPDNKGFALLPLRNYEPITLFSPSKFATYLQSAENTLTQKQNRKQRAAENQNINPFLGII